MNFKIKSLILILLLLIIGISSVSASEIDNNNVTLSENIPIIQSDDSYQNDILTGDLDDFQEEDDNYNHQDNVLKSTDSQESLHEDDSDVITVNNWDELQYYCSLKDEDYTLKLKENTNFYPTNPKDSNYQIKVYNNVKIIGSNGSYIGDKSSNPATIQYASIVVPDGYKSSIYLENVVFKWISTSYSSDGVFLQMGGKLNNVLKNCSFINVNVNTGHATIVYLKKGTATLDECSFINCTSCYGCVSIYDPNSVKTNDMVVRNCYFEGNYARTEPGCINNCGKLTVYNTTFVKNRSFWWAGAIHTHYGGNTTIYDSNFTDNVAGWNGGALYTYSYLQIYNTVFVGNNCTTNNGGGAIGACAYQSKPHIYIENCLFEKNENLCWSTNELSSGTGVGGAIAFMDEGSICVLNTTFIANAAAHGTAISANAAGEYGSPNVIIKNNTFINHTRVGDVLYVNLVGSSAIIEDNYFYGNSVEFSSLVLTEVSTGKDQVILQVSASLTNPNYYDEDVLNKTLYDVYINGNYVKTVGSSIFSIDFDELDICNVYVVPTISNRKSNEVTVACIRDYIYVSKSLGNDSYDGLSRQTPVSSIKKALELAKDYQNILILDGVYDEENFNITYDLTIKGEGNATLTNNTSFIVNTNNFTLKNIKITNLSNIDAFIMHNEGNLVISNCVFNNNNASRLIDVDNVDISKSIFTNNKVVVYNRGVTTIKNSILLNNSKIIDNNIDDCILDYNWWGNTLNNISKPDNLNFNNWLVLNVTNSIGSLEYGQSSNVQFNCYLFENNKLIKYNDLVKFNLEIDCVNGIANKNIVGYNSNVVYTQSGFDDGFLTASYNGIVMSILFNFVKSNPNISIDVDNVLYGQNVIVSVFAPSDIEGNMTVRVGDKSQTKMINSSEFTFTFRNLKANDYNVVVNFTGDNKYSSQIIEDSVSVLKYDSTTKITVGNVNVGSDVTITVTTSKNTAGMVTLSINDIVETLLLKNNKATYTLANVSRGDYLIKAFYNGNEKYASSSDQLLLEVDNLIPDIDIFIENSTYGEVSIVEINLNDDNASGFIIVTVDGISNSSEVVSGKSNVYIRGIDAGVDKEITIFYSGDNTYFNKTVTSSMTVLKANFTFSISSQNIMVGQDAVVLIAVPAKTTGNFTIDGNVFAIPMSGEVSYCIPNLEIGNYTVTAVYNGNNYNTVVNSTSFSVIEYNISQWANDGGNAQNTHKSAYETNCEGDIIWNLLIDGKIIGNLAIDNEGNIYVISTTGIYSFDDFGNLRWVYQSDGRLGNFSGLAIGRDVIISPRTGDTLYLINQYDGVNYGFSNIFQASSLFAPVIDLNATVYTVSEYQVESSSYNLVIIPYRLWNGGDPIVVNLGSTIPIASPTLNEEVVVVLGENRLMIFDAHNLLLNSAKIGNFKNIRPVIGEGNVIYTILGDSVVAFINTGAQFGKKVPITGGAGDNLLVDNDLGIVYATNSKGNLYKYDLITGEELLVSRLNITSGILIDSNSNLFFGCDNLFYKIDSEGNVLWKSNLSSKITGTPVMNKAGIIYVTSEDNKLFALGNVTLKDSGLEVTATNVSEGSDVIITIMINNETTGNVSFTINTIDYSFETSNGTIIKAISNLPAGTYNVNVTYGGDLRFNKTSKVVTFTVKAKPAPVIPNPVLKGSDITVLYTSNSYYKVKLTQNNAPLVGKTIAINFNGANYNIVTDKNGIASFKITAKPGKYTIKALYQGKTAQNTVTVKSILQAKNLKVKKSAKSAKIKVTLKKVNGKYLKSKTLKLKINGKTLKAKTNKKGVATFKLNKSLLKKLKKGKKYTYTVTYLKDSVKKSLKVK
jgi:hypothetical protein